MEKLKLKLVIVYFLIVASSVNGQIYIGTPSQIAGGMTRDALANAITEVLNATYQKHQLTRDLNSIRSRYWGAESKGLDLKELGEEYSRLLFEKDMYFFDIFYQKTKLKYLGYEEQFGKFGDLIDFADFLTGGSIDNGIHDEAKQAYNAWISTSMYKWKKQSNSVFEVESLIQIVLNDSIYYPRYVKIRNAVEAYKKNSFSQNKYKAEYDKYTIPNLDILSLDSNEKLTLVSFFMNGQYYEVEFANENNYGYSKEKYVELLKVWYYSNYERDYFDVEPIYYKSKDGVDYFIIIGKEGGKWKAIANKISTINKEVINNLNSLYNADDILSAYNYFKSIILTPTGYLCDEALENYINLDKRAKRSFGLLAQISFSSCNEGKSIAQQKEVEYQTNKVEHQKKMKKNKTFVAERDVFKEMFKLYDKKKYLENIRFDTVDSKGYIVALYGEIYNENSIQIIVKSIIHNGSQVNISLKLDESYEKDICNSRWLSNMLKEIVVPLLKNWFPQHSSVSVNVSLKDTYRKSGSLYRKDIINDNNKRIFKSTYDQIMSELNSIVEATIANRKRIRMQPKSPGYYMDSEISQVDYGIISGFIKEDMNTGTLTVSGACQGPTFSEYIGQ